MQQDILRTMALLRPYDVGCGKVRIGESGDGGYVMADDFAFAAIAYSIGVGPQVQWDVDMAGRGLKVWQYDLTVDSVPASHPAFHYERLGIGPDLSDPQLLTLAEMLRRNGHADMAGMILKIDVEGAEWDVIDAMDDAILARFDQIVIEIHGMEYLVDEPFRARAERVLGRLARHHVPIHVHGNNYAGYHICHGVPVPGCIEVSYARRGRFQLTPAAGTFPTPLDTPCDPARPDLMLGSFRFS